MQRCLRRDSPSGYPGCFLLGCILLLCQRLPSEGRKGGGARAAHWRLHTSSVLTTLCAKCNAVKRTLTAQRISLAAENYRRGAVSWRCLLTVAARQLPRRAFSRAIFLRCMRRRVLRVPRRVRVAARGTGRAGKLTQVGCTVGGGPKTTSGHRRRNAVNAAAPNGLGLGFTSLYLSRVARRVAWDRRAFCRTRQ